MIEETATRAQSLRTILVPLDGSGTAERALDFAERIASRSPVQIVVLRSALAQTPADGADGCAEREVSRVVAESRRYLGEVERGLRNRGFSCRSVVPYGPPADSVLSNSELQGADLVIMSAQGLSGPSAWNHGGVADKIVQGLTRSVLLIQGTGGLTDGGVALLPLDGSELAESAVGQAADVASNLGLKIVLMTVVTPDGRGHAFRWNTGITENGETASSRARAYLGQIADSLNASGHSAAVEIAEGLPHDEILKRAMKSDVSMVVMSAHGLSGLGRWVYGGVATKVLHQSGRPVLLFRDPTVRALYEEKTPIRRCHNCGRPAYRQFVAALDVCPLCGFPLRVCANCSHHDGVICKMDNPWNGGISAHNPCEDFSFRETSRTRCAARGR